MRYITKKEVVIPKRKSDSHKGDAGKALVIGGSKDYVGAVVLAGLAALRSGVDWVTVAAPEKVGWAVNSLSEDLVVKKFKGENFSVTHLKGIQKLEKTYDTILIGNGIGIKSKEFVKKYVKQTKKPLVIDADAIKHVSLDIVDNAILTPHARELELFLKNSKINKKIFEKIKKEKNIQKKSKLIKKTLKNKKITILLKGKIDAIISKDKISYNKTGNPGMTKAGTGDVLAGLCLGYVTQGLSLFQSAINAAYINGQIGDILLKKKKGFTYLASDMVKELKSLNKKL